jgi:hypothetical protein
MADTDKDGFEYSADEVLDVLALSYDVERESESGTVAREFLKKGQTLYAPAPEGGGLLSAHCPNGSIVKGRLKNGIFVPAS